MGEYLLLFLRMTTGFYPCPGVACKDEMLILSPYFEALVLELAVHASSLGEEVDSYGHFLC